MINKKIFLYSLTFSLISILSSCNKNQNASISLKQNQSQIQDIITQDPNQINQDNQIVILPIPTQEVEIEMPLMPSEQEIYEQCKSSFTKSSKIDIDLSTMGSTMIFSMVFNMLIKPEEYDNQNLKIKGNFVVYISKENNQRYFSIIIPDATQCCQQGIPFIWFGETKNYPNDFPAIGTEVTLIGKYKTIETKNGFTYSFLQASEIEY